MSRPVSSLLPLLAGFFTALLLLAPMDVRAQSEPHRMTVLADSAGPIINRHLFGHFGEHLGRNIYGGFWVRDESGQWALNQAVIEALREIDPPNLRWPGGCFADQYHWRDGIGPRDDRPAIVNTLWGGVTEDNSFGTHEFLALVEALGAEPIIVGNVGSGTVEEMADWWEYVNHPGPSPMADLRAANGRSDPWNVRFWGVGNESWGCGGNMRAEYYADLYKRFATYLHAYGPTRPFRIATGPDATIPHNLPEWTDTVMREAGAMIDGLDMHYYTIVGSWDERTRATEFSEREWIDGLRRAMVMEDHIVRVSEIMDRYDPERRVWLIVGEWGMWHQVEEGTNPGFLHQQNTLRDALVASITLDIFAQHADRVRMANIAQTVNVLQAMLLTDEDRVVRTPTFHVFEMYKVHQDATALPFQIDRGSYTFGDVTIPALSAAASRDAEGRTHVSLTNTDPDRARSVEVTLTGTMLTRVSGRILTADAMQSHNTLDVPGTVVPKPFADADLEGEVLRVALPPKSVVVLRLE